MLSGGCGFFCCFFLFCFQQLVLYVSVAVTGIYKVSIAYTPCRYMFLKTEAVYLVVKTPKWWKMIRGNSWSVTCLQSLSLISFVLYVYLKSSSLLYKLSAYSWDAHTFVISLLSTPPPGKLMRVAICGSSVAQWFALISWAIISLLSLC